MYSSSGNPVSAFASVTPIVLSGQSLININGVSYIELQHIKLDWYDGYGMQVQGASDHIWLANMMADSRCRTRPCRLDFIFIPAALPATFIFNTDAHRNYVGYRFDGTATAVELKNCRAYANRTYGLMDAITNRQIVDEQKFKDGLGKVIDGTVECLNASMWAKQN